MKNVKQWLRIDPLDTLFFKGSESMVAGQDHEVGTIFPPMPSTITGALRGAILGQRNILGDFISDDHAALDAVKKQYPHLGTPEKAGFDILGPVFEYRGDKDQLDIFLPAPAHWFGALKNLEDGVKVTIQASQPIQSIVEATGMTGSVPEPLWVIKPAAQDMKNLTGFLVNKTAFDSMKNGKADLFYSGCLKHARSSLPMVLPLSAIFGREDRVGIALDDTADTRRVKTGHLYATSHARLKSGISLVIGLSEALIPDYLDETGILQLGGELRVVGYEQYKDPISISAASGTWAMALTPIPARQLDSSGLDQHPRASGALIRMGGWDMKKGFHKDMIAYFPAGTTIHVDKNTPLPFGFTHI